MASYPARNPTNTRTGSGSTAGWSSGGRDTATNGGGRGHQDSRELARIDLAKRTEREFTYNFFSALRLAGQESFPDTSSPAASTTATTSSSSTSPIRSTSTNQAPTDSSLAASFAHVEAIPHYWAAAAVLERFLAHEENRVLESVEDVVGGLGGKGGAGSIQTGDKADVGRTGGTGRSGSTGTEGGGSDYATSSEGSATHTPSMSLLTSRLAAVSLLNDHLYPALEISLSHMSYHSPLSSTVTPVDPSTVHPLLRTPRMLSDHLINKRIPARLKRLGKSGRGPDGKIDRLGEFNAETVKDFDVDRIIESVSVPLAALDIPPPSLAALFGKSNNASGPLPSSVDPPISAAQAPQPPPPVVLMPRLPPARATVETNGSAGAGTVASTLSSSAVFTGAKGKAPDPRRVGAATAATDTVTVDDGGIGKENHGKNFAGASTAPPATPPTTPSKIPVSAPFHFAQPSKPYILPPATPPPNLNSAIAPVPGTPTPTKIVGSGRQPLRSRVTPSKPKPGGVGAQGQGAQGETVLGKRKFTSPPRQEATLTAPATTTVDVLDSRGPPYAPRQPDMSHVRYSSTNPNPIANPPTLVAPSAQVKIQSMFNLQSHGHAKVTSYASTNPHQQQQQSHQPESSFGQLQPQKSYFQQPQQSYQNANSYNPQPPQSHQSQAYQNQNTLRPLANAPPPNVAPSASGPAHDWGGGVDAGGAWGPPGQIVQGRGYQDHRDGDREQDQPIKKTDFQTGREKMIADGTPLPGWRPLANPSNNGSGNNGAAKRPRFNAPALVGPVVAEEDERGSAQGGFGFYAFNRPPTAQPTPTNQTCYSIAGTNRKKQPAGPGIGVGGSGARRAPGAGAGPGPGQEDLFVDERLRNVDPKLVEMIEGEMVPRGQTGGVGWDDIAGLRHAKAAMTQAIVWPMQRPELFTGLRAPPRGVLLYGPPGTGKTLIAKAIASQCNTDFFSISASTLTSKWVGEGEKTMRALFAVARVHQPAVIFIDEIDSLLTARSDGENEGSRRLKTEFLVQVDGCNTNGEDRVLIIGATNRFVLMFSGDSLDAKLSDEHGQASRTRRGGETKIYKDVVDMICDRTEGYSGSDIHNLCKDAVMCPITSVADISALDITEIRPVLVQVRIDARTVSWYESDKIQKDFESAIQRVKPTVAPKDLEIYLKFEKEFGSLR
ncbi:hypothetical protein HDU93_002575 [Gonapodya sp. JEL0774]|nr:hypothetical protein HDU93_002575 [Gonapodya sp. JEL0774]